MIHLHSLEIAMVFGIIMTTTTQHTITKTHMFTYIATSQSWLSPQQHSIWIFIITLPDLYMHNFFHLSFFCLATHFWFRMGSFSSPLFVATTI